MKFLKNRNNPEAFEPAPGTEKEAEKEEVKVSAAKGSVEAYSVKVDGQVYNVEVGPQGVISSVEQISAQAAPVQSPQLSAMDAESVDAPLAGNIFKVLVQAGAEVVEGDVLLILEAMKMETEIKASRSGTVQDILTKEGDAVTVGTPLLSLA